MGRGWERKKRKGGYGGERGEWMRGGERNRRAREKRNIWG